MFVKILNNDGILRDSFDDFESFVWNERLTDPGDFTISVPYSVDVLNKFPYGTLVQASNSDVLMMVDGYSVSDETSRKNTLTIKGHSLDSVFKGRPAVKTFDFKEESSDEEKWEYGDEDPAEDATPLQPLALMTDILNFVDAGHYMDERLKNLVMPFEYLAINEKDRSMPSRPLWYFEVDRSKNVYDVMKEVCSADGLYFTTASFVPPTVAARSIALKNKDDRPFRFIFYYPQNKFNTVSFTDYKDDYQSLQIESNFQDFMSGAVVESDNSVLMSTAQGFGPAALPSLANRFSLVSEVFSDNKNLYELERFDKLVKTPVETYTGSASVSLTMSGEFPYDRSKKFSMFSQQGLKTYYLGDVVRVKSGMFKNIFGEEEIAMRITEYIRTQDASGYKEYPTLNFFTGLDSADRALPISPPIAKIFKVSSLKSM